MNQNRSFDPHAPRPRRPLPPNGARPPAGQRPNGGYNRRPAARPGGMPGRPPQGPQARAPQHRPMGSRPRPQGPRPPYQERNQAHRGYPQGGHPAAPSRRPAAKPKKAGASRWVLILLDVLIVAIIAVALYFFLKPKLDEKNADQLQQEILKEMNDKHQAVQVEVDKEFGKVQGERMENFGGVDFVDNDQDYDDNAKVSLTYVGRLVIPKINVVTPLSEDTTAAALLPALRFGVGMLHAPLTEPGLTTIWGHRFLTKGRDFNRLDEVQVGDQFYIDYMPTGERYYYTVYQTDIIPWQDLEGRVSEYFEDNRVVLITCHPPVYNEQNERIMVYAKPDLDKTTKIPE